MFSAKRDGKNVQCLFVILFAVISTPIQADIIFTAPPREHPEKAKELYEPIAEKLSAVLGEKVIFQPPKSWAHYAKNMRSGHYDIIFDGPHFAAWRVKNLDHIPVAALPGKLDFLIVARQSDTNIKDTRSLVGQKICAMVSPHLGTDLIYDLFHNPVLLPDLYEVSGGMPQVYKAFKEGKCRATILRAPLFNHLPEAERKALKVVAKTRTLPNQTVTVSQKLQNNASKIAEFLTSKDGAITADKLLSRFSKNNKQFQKTSAGKYAGAEEILEGVVWGW